MQAGVAIPSRRAGKRKFQKRRAREKNRRRDKNERKGGTKLLKNRDWREFL